MNIVCVHMYGDKYGYGHYVRSTEFALAASDNGHRVTVRKNKVAHVPKDVDWVVIDAPPAERAELIKDVPHGKVCILGADAEDKADLVWVEDDPSKVIIRKRFIHADMPKYTSADFYVYESSTMPLSCRVTDAFPDAFMYVVNNASCMTDTYTMIRASRNVCTYMGMTAWEAAAMGKQVFLFSPSEYHLFYARQMQAFGLAKAYPVTGVPLPHKIREFITPYEMNEESWNKIDGMAASRLLEAMKE